ncbi:hypothetical protein LguiB_022297 [Lonicera macranthoides]
MKSLMVGRLTLSLLMHDKLVDADDEVKFSGPEVHLGDRGICGGSRRQCKENMKRVFTSRGDDRNDFNIGFSNGRETWSKRGETEMTIGTILALLETVPVWLSKLTGDLVNGENGNEDKNCLGTDVNRTKTGTSLTLPNACQVLSKSGTA